MCGAPAPCDSCRRRSASAQGALYALCRRTHVSGRLSLVGFHIYIIYNTECQGLWGLEMPLSARKIDIGIPTRLVSRSWGGVRRRSGSATASAHRVGSWIRRRCHHRMASGRLSKALNHPPRPPRRAQPLRSALADAESSRAKGRHESNNIIDLARGVVSAG